MNGDPFCREKNVNRESLLRSKSLLKNKMEVLKVERRIAKEADGVQALDLKGSFPKLGRGESQLHSTPGRPPGA